MTGAFSYKSGKRAGPVKQQPLPGPDTAIDPAWGEVNVDPYAVAANADRGLVASALADTGMWIEQFVEELAALTQRERRLLCKLQDPALAEHPKREGAVYRAAELEEDIADRVRGLIETEARADRRWQFLTPDERTSTHADYWWRADAGQDRLIGQVWLRFAPLHDFPPGWQINRFWLKGLPLAVVIDLRTFKALGHTPRPRPPSIFDDHRNDPLPDDLKDEILKGRKH